jgi:DHHC palmitoyltransferase
MNRKDQAGVIMAFLVWLLISESRRCSCQTFFCSQQKNLTNPPPFPRTVYSGVTVTLLAHHNHLPGILAMLYCTICALALASHAKTVFTDPGSIPQSAVPRPVTPSTRMHAMCSHCQTYKPPLAHHCRICNRCISRMDHHCPWMNNCVGIGNLSEYGSWAIRLAPSMSHFICVSKMFRSRALYSLSCIHMDWFCLCIANLCMELLSLRL